MYCRIVETWDKATSTAAEIEDERKVNNPPTFNGYTYSGETSDDEDPNDAYYYAGKQIFHQM